MAGQAASLWLCIVCFGVLFPREATCMNKSEKAEMRAKVLEMFDHVYSSYMLYAFPADELMPLSCKGRYRGVDPSRGDIDDILGNYSLTLVDSLDTLALLGRFDEFEKAVRNVIARVRFDQDVVVSVFEVNIRMVGGLLGGHVAAAHLQSRNGLLPWYRNELLSMAKDLAIRLLPAFATTSGLPVPRINLLRGIDASLRDSEREKFTCTACAGTMILEFAALSRLTGDPVFEDKANAALDYLWRQRHRSSDLVGTIINVQNGEWVRRDSGVGAGIDSYYEYLLKAYVLLGDEVYLHRFNTHYRAIMRYVSQGPMLIDVHMHRPYSAAKNWMDSLLAFWPGLQVLKGDIKPAVETHEMLHQVIRKHNFLPEAFTTDLRVHWGHHLLRPEFAESTYFLYKATGDPHYLHVGKLLVHNMDRYARVRCGYAALQDVRTGKHEDRLDSFVLAEMFKYLYLMFSEPEHVPFDLERFVFTTEAHLLPIRLPSVERRTSLKDSQEARVAVADEEERICRNPSLHSQPDYAQVIRESISKAGPASGDMPSCPRATSSREPRLRASDFAAGNEEQLRILSRMGIRLVTMNDGRVQLLHTSSEATSLEDAEDGMLFMQEMIELSQQQGNLEQPSRVVQLLSPPHWGALSFTAGPAQFGVDFTTNSGLHGPAKRAESFQLCEEPANPFILSGRIVIAQRGGCMFIDKARFVQNAGAIGLIVIDNHRGSTSATSPVFAMSGDGRNDVEIPVMFLFELEGERLLQELQLNPDMIVYIGSKALSEENVRRSFNFPSRPGKCHRVNPLLRFLPPVCPRPQASQPDPIKLSPSVHLIPPANGEGQPVLNIRLDLLDPSSSRAPHEVFNLLVEEVRFFTNIASLANYDQYMSLLSRLIAAATNDGNGGLFLTAEEERFLQQLARELKPLAAVQSAGASETGRGRTHTFYYVLDSSVIQTVMHEQGDILYLTHQEVMAGDGNRSALSVTVALEPKSREEKPPGEH